MSMVHIVDTLDRLWMIDASLNSAPVLNSISDIPILESVDGFNRLSLPPIRRVRYVADMMVFITMDCELICPKLRLDEVLQQLRVVDLMQIKENQTGLILDYDGIVYSYYLDGTTMRIRDVLCYDVACILNVYHNERQGMQVFGFVNLFKDKLMLYYVNEQFSLQYLNELTTPHPISSVDMRMLTLTNGDRYLIDCHNNDISTIKLQMMTMTACKDVVKNHYITIVNQYGKLIRFVKGRSVIKDKEYNGSSPIAKILDNNGKMLLLESGTIILFCPRFKSFLKVPIKMDNVEDLIRIK